MKRLPSIDIARGLVMVIMALDHTRDMLGVAQDPTNLATTTPLLFFTRWVTHICAPSFVFLSGVSAYLAIKGRAESGSRVSRGSHGSGAMGSPANSARMNGSPANSYRMNGSSSWGFRFLLTRGIWLIFVEFTLVNFALFFDVHFRLFLFEVIAAIGAGFILLSFLSRLSSRVLAVIGLIILFGHDLTALVPTPQGFVFSLLFSRGAFPLPGGRLFVESYPIIPWLGIMLLGFASGGLFEKNAQERKRLLLRMGLASIGLFFVIRGINIYGDPSRLAMQKNGVFTLLSFLNLTKYPPSLLFSLCMLGILMFVLWLAEGKDNRVTRILQVYGRTPLFYFIVHFYLIHSLMLSLVLIQGHLLAELPFGPFLMGRPTPGWGLSLGWVYGIWAGVVIVLFPLCRWYGAYKARHRDWWWLRYL